MNDRALIVVALIITTIFMTTSCKKEGEEKIAPSVLIIQGVHNGIVGTVYDFSAILKSYDSDLLRYRFDWGDGDTTNWSDFVPYDSAVMMSHAWIHAGTYYVKAQAMNEKGLKTDWSGAYQVVIIDEESTGWQKTFGGRYWDAGYSIQKTYDGGYIILGETQSYGEGYLDVYLIKTDAAGNLEWQKTFGGSGADEGYSIQQSRDGGYIIVGATTSYGTGFDVYLIKTDASGNLLWQKTFGGSDDDIGISVQQTQDGGYIIVGTTWSYGSGYQDVYLIKTDATGELEWEKTFGGNSDDYGRCVRETRDGGYIIAGGTLSYGAGYWDIYLIKTDASGNLLWQKTFGGESEDFGDCVRQTRDGGYIVIGNTSSYGVGGYDIYLIRTGATGNLLWDRTYGGGSDDFGVSIQTTLDGGYIITGQTYSYGARRTDVYLIKTNASGDLVWQKIFGGIGDDEGYSVQQTNDGGYIIVGETSSFGAGHYDVYLIKTDASGNVSDSTILKINHPVGTTNHRLLEGHLSGR